ncbi:MAG TPA: choice-of-anchor A family protein [Melioribacteraceae bacterium]|nr:choice-of-anchor A family protein [Melioribacteraceae bacterium]
MKNSKIFNVLIGLLVIANTTFAQNPNELLNKWNAIVSNNITSVSEIEGRLFVGNNYNVQNAHQYGFRLNSNPANDVVFTVGGTVTTNGQANIKVFYGSAAIAGSVSQTNWFEFHNGGSLIQNSNYAAQNSPVAALTAASAYWATLTPNGTVSYPTNQPAPLRFTCPSGQELAVFNITDVLSLENSKVQQIEIIPAAATKTVIINIASVDGTVNWNYGNMVGNLDNQNFRSKVIWNIYTTANNGQLNSVNCMPNMKGALIAPGATVTGNSNFDGPVFCKNLAINSEIHLASSNGWQGNAPEVPSVPTCTQSWSGSLGADETVCNYDATIFTATGTITKQPSNAKAYLQVYWKLVAPTTQDTSTYYSSKWIYSDTTVAVSGNWPGILATDTFVQLKVGMRLYNCDMEKLGNDVVKNYTWNTNVCPPPAANEADIKVEKTVSSDSVQNGSQITFTIKATNNGPKDASNIVVNDQLASGLTYVSSSATVGTYNSSTGLWTIPALNNGQSATLSIVVKAEVTSSQSGSLNLGNAAPYNLFVLENFSSPSSDVEGRMAVGNNVFMSNYSVGYNQPADNYATQDVFVVGGNLTFLSGSVYNGNLVYGGSTNLPINQVSVVGGVLRQDSVINFDSTSVALRTLANQILLMPSTGSVTYEYGGIFLNGNNPITNVFHISAEKLSTANDVQIFVPSSSVVLVNVYGENVNWQGGFVVHGTTRNNVIFTFEAETINIHNIDVTASILAPFAALTFPSGVIHGQVVCKSMTGSGQFNYAPFLGNIPVDSNYVNTAYVVSSSPVDPNSLNNSSTVGFKVTVNASNTGSTTEWNILPGSGSMWVMSAMMTDIVRNSNNTIFMAQQGGVIYKSVNNGQDWEKIQSNLQVAYIWKLARDGGNKLYAATERGLYSSTNDGVYWVKTAFGDYDIRGLAIDALGKIYVGTWGTGVYSSNDGGNTWIELNNGLDIKNVHTLALMGNKLFCGTFGGGVYKLETTNPTAWVKEVVGYNHVWTLAVTHDNVLLAGTYGGGMYRSVDGGSTWQLAINGINSRYIYHIFVGSNNVVYASGWAAGIFASTNNGENWSSGGLEGLGINLAFSSGSSSKEAGQRVYAVSANGTIYYTDSPFTSVEENIQVNIFELGQNFPNPFNPSTTIMYQIPTNGIVSLKIYNILGQEVSTLINEYQVSGKYSVVFNAKNLASGMYIYQLKAGNITQSKKLMLLK